MCLLHSMMKEMKVELFGFLKWNIDFYWLTVLEVNSARDVILHYGKTRKHPENPQVTVFSVTVHIGWACTSNRVTFWCALDCSELVFVEVFISTLRDTETSWLSSTGLKSELDTVRPQNSELPFYCDSKCMIIGVSPTRYTDVYLLIGKATFTHLANVAPLTYCMFVSHCVSECWPVLWSECCSSSVPCGTPFSHGDHFWNNAMKINPKCSYVKIPISIFQDICSHFGTSLTLACCDSVYWKS